MENDDFDLNGNDLFFLLAHYEEELRSLTQKISHLYDMIVSIQKESAEKIRQASFHPQNTDLGARIQTSGGSDLFTVLQSVSQIKKEEVQDISEQISVIKARKDQLTRIKISYDLISKCWEKEIFEVFLKAEKMKRNPEPMILQKGIQRSRAYKIRKKMLETLTGIYASDLTTLQLLQISPMGLKKAQNLFLKEQGHN